MKQLIFVIIAAVVFSSTSFAQSGRRIKPKTTPTPKSNTTRIDPNVYSESRPYKPIKLTPGKRNKPKRKPKVIQTKAPASANSDGEDEIISVESALVNIPVSVFDKNGIYVPYIRKEEFKIFEDGKEQEIAYFGTNDQPFTVALVIDTSGSTHFKIRDIHFAAKAFVRQLEPRDRVIVVEFSDNVRVRAEATNERSRLDRAIEKARFGGATSIYDAVEFVLKKRMNKIKGRKAIVLFTDGVDTSSNRATFYENFEDAEESDTLIYPVYYNTFLSGRTSGTILNSPWPGVGGGAAVNEAKAHTFGKTYLENLAAYTGGRVFHAGRSRSLLVQAFRGIAEELRTQYNIGYSPIAIGEKGDRKRIKVRVYRPNLRVRARDSYIVGEYQLRGDAN